MNKINHRTRTVYVNELGKLPPQDKAIEEAVLGAIMLEKDKILSVLEVFQNPEVFYYESNRNVFQACLNLFNKSEPIDLVTVADELRKMGVLENIGGVVYVAGLTNDISSAAHISRHAAIINNLFIKREVITQCNETLTRAFENDSDGMDLVSSLSSASANYFTGSKAKASSAILPDVMGEVLRRMESPGLTGIPSGLRDLDRLTGGWQKTDLILLAGRPAMGKTAAGVSVGIGAAKHGYKVAVFELEMSTLQLGFRIIGNTCAVNIGDLIKGTINKEDYAALLERVRAINLPIWIDDTPSLSIVELRAKARRLKQLHDIDLIVVDYLQLLTSPGAASRENEIATISRSLKALAKELNVPIIALSQLNRDLEKRTDKRPRLSDIRESGQIEQDCDMICFLHREEYYLNPEDIPEELIGQLEIIIAKFRNGELGTANVRFWGEYSLLTDNEVTAIQQKVVLIEQPDKRPVGQPIRADFSNFNGFEEPPF